MHDAIITGVSDYFAKTGFKSCISVSRRDRFCSCMCIAAEALGNNNVRVLLMPSRYSSDHSVKDAVELAEKLIFNMTLLILKNLLPLLNLFSQPVFTNKDTGCN